MLIKFKVESRLEGKGFQGCCYRLNQEQSFVFFFIWVFLHLAPSPRRQEHHGCAVASLEDPDPRYALNLLRVLTTAVLAAAKNGALRSINSPVCWSERENQAQTQREREREIQS